MSPEDLPPDLNPGIVRTVRWLRFHGFKTCDSGDGGTHLAECDRPYAYVSMRTTPSAMYSETESLKELLVSIGFSPLPISHAFDPEGTLRAPCIQLTYDPVDGIAVIDLMGVCDALLPDE